jgi:hypothetical protein
MPAETMWDGPRYIGHSIKSGTRVLPTGEIARAWTCVQCGRATATTNEMYQTACPQAPETAEASDLLLVDAVAGTGKFADDK